MSGSDDQSSNNQGSDLELSQTTDSGEVFFKTPAQKADRVVSTLEKDDSATNLDPLTFGQDLSVIPMTEDMAQSPEKPLSDLEKFVQLMQESNRLMMESINGNANNNIEAINGSIEAINSNIERKIAENTQSIRLQIAQIKEDNKLQMEKINESIELRINSFINQQEKDTKFFMSSVDQNIDDKIELTKTEIKCIINEEVESRETQAQMIQNTIEHNKMQLWEKLQEYKEDNYESRKANEENLGLLNEKVFRNTKTIAIIHREVEVCAKQNGQVIEEMAVIKDKLDNNVTSAPMVMSHSPNIRISIPTFSGNTNTSMAPHFLNTLEEYFEITNVHKSQWLTYLGQAFQGSAMAWFRQVKPTCTNWDSFKAKFLESYHGAVQRMRYAAQVEEGKQRIDEKAESFIWRMNDVMKLAYPYLKEEEIVMHILRKMKCGFGALIRDNIRSILELVQKANEMEEVIKIDGRNSNKSSNSTDNNESGNSHYNKQGQSNQHYNYRSNNDEGSWRNNGYRSDRNRFQDRTPQGDNDNQNHSQNDQKGPKRTDKKDSQPIPVATVGKGKGVGKKSGTYHDTNAARSQQDGHLNGSGSTAAGQVVTPSTST